MSILQSVARNIAMLTASRFVTWIAAFAFTIAQARYLGPGHFGELSVALTFAALLAIVMDFGLGTQLSRMVAQRSPGNEQALAATIAIRAGLWVVAAPALLLVCVALGYSAELQLTVLLLAVSIFLVGISNTIASFLQGHEEFALPAFAAVAQGVTAAAIGGLILAARPEIAAVAYAFVAAGLVSLAVLSLSQRVRESLRHPRVDARAALRLLRAGVPLGVYAIATTVYFSVDMVMLQRLAAPENVGWYAAAYRPFGAATLFPSIVAGTVLYPVLSRLSLGSRDELGAVIEKSLTVLTLAGVGVALVFALFAERIVGILYPAQSYAEAAGALRLLAPGLLFIYVNWALATALLGLRLERRLIVMAVTVALLNPLMNLVAIPLFQERGAAFTTSLTELIVLVWLVRMMPRDLLRLASVRVGAKAAAAAVLTAVVLAPLRDLPLVMTVPFAILLYAAAALAVRAVTARELAALGAVVLPLSRPARGGVR
jgi:O-antigen/teichoic acid export membrane protein